VKISLEERATRRLHADTLERATEALRADAFVVLEGLLDDEAIERARVTCRRVLDRKNRHRTPLPFELVRRVPFKGFAEHPIIVQVAASVLGGACAPQGFRWIRRSPPGGSAIGRVHRDTAGLRDVEGGGLPMRLSVDVMLTDFTEDNGATQIWPGTQGTVESNVDERKSVGERASKIPSVHITGPAGSVAIRDERAWHRAGVNRTDQDRVMLSIGQWGLCEPSENAERLTR
jgi:ectoine hydroxylase-related dioxygenase (phytanoyl-CoA dioxygenase family)